MKANSILVDSNIFVGAYNELDSLHEQAIEFFSDHKLTQKACNEFLYSEICTVLLLRTKNMRVVEKLDHDISHKNSRVIIKRTTIELFKKAQQIFFTQSGSTLSFADCALIAQAMIDNIDSIATFDKEIRKIFKEEFTFLPKYIY